MDLMTVLDLDIVILALALLVTVSVPLLRGLPALLTEAARTHEIARMSRQPQPLQVCAPGAERSAGQILCGRSSPY